jgi:hypothetical protein
MKPFQLTVVIAMSGVLASPPVLSSGESGMVTLATRPAVSASTNLTLWTGADLSIGGGKPGGLIATVARPPKPMDATISVAGKLSMLPDKIMPTGHVIITAAPNPPVVVVPSEPAPQLATQWVAKVFGNSIGTKGIMHIDINNDGVEELVFASTVYTGSLTTLLSVLSYQPTSKTWTLTRQNRFANTTVTALYTYLSNGNKPMLALGLVDNMGKVSLKIQSLADNKTVKDIAINTKSTAVNEILLGDADNDGGNELIAITEKATHLYNIADYSASGNFAYGAQHAAFGNVDNDADNELVYNTGKIVSYKTAKITLKVDYGLGFGNWVRVANIDGDAAAEVIMADGWGYVRAFDADIQSVKWEHATAQDIAALRVVDINHDGKDDIVYGDGQWGSLNALDNNGALFWSLANPDSSMTDIAVLDADGDGDQDIAWASDKLYLHDLTSAKRLFQSNITAPPFRTVTFGDADNDGKQDFITVTRQGIVKVLDAVTGVQKWQSPSNLFNGFAFVGILAAAVGDVDNDGQNELVVVGDRLYDGAIYLLDVKNRKLKKTIVLDSGSPLYAVKIADVDGDGLNDIVAGGGYAHSGSPGIYAYVVDGAAGTVKWHSQNLANGGGSGVYGLDVADIDGNGNLDIVVSLDRLYIFDGVTHINAASAASDYSGISVRTIKGKPARYIVAGNQAGELQFLTSDLSPVATYPVCPTAIGAVEMLDNGKILLTCGKKLQIFDFKTKSIGWASADMANGLETDALAVTKIKGELKVGLGALFGRLLRYVPAP